MFFDFTEAWSRLSEPSAHYDVCVCGTGPAGITTARKLAEKGKRVLLLEGGGLEFDERSEDAYYGRSVGQQYWFLDVGGRLRYFGGTSNHWAGRCGIFDEIDFQARDDSGLPGWPISRSELIRRLDEAKDIVDIAGKDLSPAQIPGFISELFYGSGFANSPPTRFAEKYGPEIKRSENIDLFYNANLTDVRLTADLAGVESLIVKTYGGSSVSITAREYVLALGAVETAKILLNSSSQVPSGVGNASDMVGRCFMEHFDVPIGRFVVTDPTFWRPNQDIALAASPLLMRSQGINNGILAFNPSAAPTSYGRLRILRQFLRETGCTIPGLARRLVDFNCPGDGLITSLIEQSPNLDSRISLIDDKDAMGLRRVQLNWQLSSQDKKTIRVIALQAAQEMARQNLARVQLANFITQPDINIQANGHCHHMGTVRMSSSPRHGVVDENCRVHGVRNLYLIGSSVFPTSGGTNPTLTVVLLALRLGEFLGAID